VQDGDIGPVPVPGGSVPVCPRGRTGLIALGAHPGGQSSEGSEHWASAFLKLGIKDTSARPSSKLLADLENFRPRAT